ncbi:NAD(P)H-dependent oxidoreductase subunit E [ANME-1 cluster archaeon ex4572_4]|nr:NAD(P)H-dependent oxidoreductase subunit E [Methanophagales archaeon]OYT66764.1 MAG: NAD(P)H-dependent oxidoreductase subunit E [ANME-1 cluster archaeon ex4572_4]PXF51013.1 MAG: NAD(P)H-dependent oxidoreductase subunit E [Methanophagales archaeon]HDN68233.1 NAD(P)H-dependent oxidoreductase subunit E [Methanomicrobia archaeon]
MGKTNLKTELETGLERVEEIIEGYKERGEEGFLIQLLLDIQSEFNWIPREAIARISERLRVPKSKIYRVASFYEAMSLTPAGRHTVQVCLGTACQVRGAPKILDRLEERLRIKEGETTLDRRFSLRRVNCLGCCAMGPVVVVDGNYHGKITPAMVAGILEKYA